MLAGDFVRRAVENVSSTISQASSSVASAAQGKKRYDISNDAVEKCTLNVKCTPRKDAVTTSALSIKSGYLMKRNEQGQWVKRYVCTVPHMFLYYFDSDSAESPRGVIDLELYTNITQHKNTLKASTIHEEKMRSFHFMSDDEETLNNWLAHLLRDRYFSVCEERSAYQQMQSELTALLDTMNTQIKDVKEEKEIIDKQLQEALVGQQGMMKVIHNILVDMGITEEDMAQLDDLHKTGKCLQKGINRIQKELETRSADARDALEAQKVLHHEELEEMNEKLNAEINARKKLETLLAQEKKTSEMQLVECKNYMDAYVLEMQSMTMAKSETDEKNTTLTEQKKVLVKEVKRIRAKLADMETSLTQVGEVNNKLTAMVVALQAELKATKALCEPSALEPPFVSLDEVETLLQESHALVSKNQLVSSEADDRQRSISNASQGSPSTQAERNSMDINEFTPSGRKASFDLTSATLGHPPIHNTNVSASKSTSSAAPATSSSTFSVFSNTFSRFSSARTSVPSTSTVIASTDSHHNHTETENEKHAPSKQLHCLRCGGTVEGPQFSTCKCSTPALVREDLANETSSAGRSSWGFGNLLSKSSNAFVGSLNKLTTKDKSGDVLGNSAMSVNTSGGSMDGTERTEAVKVADDTSTEVQSAEKTSIILPTVSEDVKLVDNVTGSIATDVGENSPIKEAASDIEDLGRESSPETPPLLDNDLVNDNAQADKEEPTTEETIIENDANSSNS